MPRQLDKATNEDVVQANGTLNTFLAGRTKSWMTNGNPVRPTPRPPAKVAGPIPPRITTTTTTTTTPSASNVLLSPTPSIEENTPLSQSASNGHNPGNIQNQDSNSPPTASNPSRQSLNERSDNDPNPRGTTYQESTWESQAPPQQTMPQTPSTVRGSAVHTSASATENSWHGQARVFNFDNMPQTQPVPQAQTGVQNTPIQQLSHDQPNSSPRAAQLPLPSTMIHGPSTSSSGSSASSFPSRGPPTAGQAMNPPKRQRTHPPAMPSLQPRVAIIRQYIASAGGAQALSAVLERPRFALLEQACIEDDSFYIALHQLFCVWDLNNQSLPSDYQFPASANLIAGFRILGQLIKANSGLKLNHLHWFAQFPSPLADLLRTSEPYRRSINAACLFLFTLGNEWDKLSGAWRSRGYPPLVDELVTKLGCMSPILQQIIFTASRRNLGYEDDNYGTRLEDIFRLDRSGHKSIAERIHTASPPTQGEITRRNEDLTQIYLLVREQRLKDGPKAHSIHARRALGSTGVQNPVVPSNGSNTLSTGSISPNTWNNSPGRPHNPHPAPITVTSRSAGTHVTASSPSPTSMQNLSMNPPNQPGQFVQYSYPPANTNEEHLPLPSQMVVQNSSQVPMQQTASPYDQYTINNIQRQQVAQQQQQLRRNPQNTQRRPVPQLPQNQGVSQQNGTGNLRHYFMPSIRAPRSAPTLPSQSKVHNPVDIYGKTHPLERNLIPPAGFVQPAQPINPDLTALHQAHLRSPRLLAVDSDYGGRYYQTVKSLVVEPIKIPFEKPFRSFQFAIDSNDFALLAKDLSTVGDKLATRFFRPGTTQYRFRCIRTSEISNICPLSEWTISDTAWPETIYADLNKKALEVRRKNLHGKDLPVDITGIVSQQNQLRLSIPKPRTGHAYYFFAIECVEMLQHDQILEMCSRNRIPFGVTMSSINKSLTISDNDDDDFQMVATDLSIDLADPFTARIFDVPIKSSNCLHRECFDMETFLQTRNPKPKRPKQPCMADQWKCPLCGKDARPYTLQIDDFLLSVRAKLAEEGNLEVKAILVSANGEWRPKPLPEPQNQRRPGGQFDDSDSEEENAAGKINTAPMPNQDSLHAAVHGVRASAVRARRPPPQVIELDSD